MIRFVVMLRVLSIAPVTPVVKVMLSPETAVAMQFASEPAPELAVVVTIQVPA
jgi:hypothetical protein